jgi:hypothetical protein
MTALRDKFAKDTSRNIGIWFRRKGEKLESMSVKKRMTPDYLMWQVELKYLVRTEHTWFDGYALIFEGNEELTIEIVGDRIFGETDVPVRRVPLEAPRERDDDDIVDPSRGKSQMRKTRRSSSNTKNQSKTDWRASR